MRYLLILLLLLISGYATAENTYYIPENNEIKFDIIRKNKIIGKHIITFNKNGERLTINIDVNIKVKFGFITIYKYSHQNTEEWENGQLYNISTNSITNSNKKYSLQGKQNNNKFEFVGIDGKKETEKDIIPISYWNTSLLNKKKILDTQKGIIRNIIIEFLNNEEIPFKEKNVLTKKYKLLFSTKHFSDEKPIPEIYLWYTNYGELMKIQFDSPEDKSIIDYIRIN